MPHRGRTCIFVRPLLAIVRIGMRQVILRFGLLATVILLLLLVGEYALFLKPRAASWMLGAAAVGLLGTGLWLGKMIFRLGRADERTPVNAEKTVEEIGISPREYDVLLLVAEGLSNQEIANRLYISESTVKTHVSNLLSKLDARRRTHAVRRARQAGILA